MAVRGWAETKVGAYPNLGGLYDAAAPALVPPTGLTIADNVIFSDRLTWKKRGGLQQQNSASIGSSPATVRCLIDYWRAGSTGTPTRKGVAVAGASIWRDDNDNVWDDISGTVSVPADSVVTSCVVGDDLVMCFAGTVPMRYTQTGNVGTLTGTPPNGNICTQHLNRCWMNDKTDPHRIYFTGLNADGSGNALYWSIANGGGSMAVENDDGDPVGITAMWQHFDMLYVAKLTKIYRIEGTTTQNFRPVLVMNGIGCVNHNMVVPVGNDVFFPSLRGFHSLGLIAQVGNIAQEKFLSSNIHRAYLSDVNHAKVQYGWGKFLPLLNAIIWAVPQGTQNVNQIAYVYSLTTNQWTRFTNFKANSMVLKYNSSERQQELHVGGPNGQVYKYNQNKRNDYESQAIDMKVKSGHIYPDTRFAHTFGYRQFNLLLVPKGNHELTFTYRTDTEKNSSGNIISTSATFNQGAAAGYNVLGNGSFLLGQTLLGSDSLVQPLCIPVTAEGRAFQWTIENNMINQDLEIAGWNLELEETSVRRNRY